MSQPRSSNDPGPESTGTEDEEDDLTFREMVEQTALQTDLGELYDENNDL